MSGLTNAGPPPAGGVPSATSEGAYAPWAQLDENVDSAELMARSDPMADASLPDMRARSRPGTAIAAMMPMIATTISSSMSVNPLQLRVFVCGISFDLKLSIMVEAQHVLYQAGKSREMAFRQASDSPGVFAPSFTFGTGWPVLVSTFSTRASSCPGVQTHAAGPRWPSGAQTSVSWCAISINTCRAARTFEPPT